MKLLLLIAAIAGVTSAAYTYRGFKAKFGWSEALEDKDYFFTLPRTTSLADGAGWRRVERPSGALLPELRMYCRPDDVNICPLYEPSGYVAGIQVAVTAEAIKDVPRPPSKMLFPWKGVKLGNTTQDYWYSSLFFVTEESLKRGAGPTSEGALTLQDTSIWAAHPGASEHLLRIPLNESSLAKTPYRKQNCIPNMGTHYYYNLTSNMSCADYFPWFMLVKGGQVIGAGFTLAGTYVKTGERDWFEAQAKGYAQLVAPDSPACLEEWVSSYGAITIHLYFIEEPWEIKCEEGDSVQALSVINKLLLNANRYGHKIYDGAKKLFSG